MNNNHIEKIYKRDHSKNNTFVIGADIGGTNSNIGIFEIQDEKPILLRSLHYKSQTITNFTLLFMEVIEYTKKMEIHIDVLCIAAAGVVSEYREFVRPTNLQTKINIKEIQKQTGISCVYLANDFEVIRYGIPCIDQNSLIEIKKGILRPQANQAILGAGTGLGKCIMIWEKDREMHVSSASEGGHSDFAAQNSSDVDLINFIQKKEPEINPISWEDILSGNGIKRLYEFFQVICKEACDINAPKPDEIFAARHSNVVAQKTVEYYAASYARCARNFALESLSFGGLFIAGGIAAHNIELFKTSWFLDHFTRNHKQKEILEEIPITIIGDYNVSLYGAALYGLKEAVCRKNNPTK